MSRSPESTFGYIPLVNRETEAHRVGGLAPGHTWRGLFPRLLDINMRPRS